MAALFISPKLCEQMDSEGGLFYWTWLWGTKKARTIE
jgi:hypothetical protein